jgi:hypothetical protein
LGFAPLNPGQAAVLEPHGNCCDHALCGESCTRPVRAEFGVDAGWTNLADDISGADAWRLGFRAGYAFLNWLQVEGQVAGSHGSEEAGSVNLDTTMLTALVNGVFNLRTRGVAPYALAGFGASLENQ